MANATNQVSVYLQEYVWYHLPYAYCLKSQMQVVMYSQLAAQCVLLLHLSAMVSKSFNFKKDKPHQVGGIIRTGQHLDSSEEFCTNGIFHEKFQASMKLLMGAS